MWHDLSFSSFQSDRVREAAPSVGPRPPLRLLRGVTIRVPLALLALPQERLRLFQISRPGKEQEDELVALTHSRPLFVLQAFSVFFICIAVTSDMICYLFIPIHWLFFAASTYVWVQYVWHTGKKT